VRACAGGFHAIEGNPLEVLNYYGPASSVYAVVTQSGQIARHDQDTKIASSKITIGDELHLHALIQRAVKWIFDTATPAHATSNAERQKFASNSGPHGAATNSGTQGAAANSGYQGAATNSGDYGAATNSGPQGAATNSGDYGAASNSGLHGAAMNAGAEGRVRGCKGSALFLVYRDPQSGQIKHAWSGIVGKTKGIKADTWYRLNGRGKPVEVNA
jgi:hypothetical protein